MYKKEYMHMHVVAESTQTPPPVLHWYSLNSIDMLDLTRLSVRLLPLTNSVPLHSAENIVIKTNGSAAEALMKRCYRESEGWKGERRKRAQERWTCV